MSISNREAAMSRIMSQEVQRYFHKHKSDLVNGKKMRFDLLYMKSTAILNRQLFTVVREKVRRQKREREG
jgi:hypothetical protein